MKFPREQNQSSSLVLNSKDWFPLGSLKPSIWRGNGSCQFGVVGGLSNCTAEVLNSNWHMGEMQATSIISHS